MTESGVLAMDADDLEGLAGFYHLLSRLWISELDDEWLTALREGTLADAASDLDLPIGGELAELRERLATEYCALLIGPQEHVSPHQSVWVEGQLQGQTVISMQQFLEVVGEEADHTLCDHLGVQLGVMARIVDELATTAAEPDETQDAVAELIGLAQAFFGTHVDWIGRFLEAARNTTNSPFYGQLVEVTREFLAEEHDIWLPAS